MEPKFDRNHPDFPWGFYTYGDRVFMVTNAHHQALKSGKAVLNVPPGNGAPSVEPAAGKSNSFWDRFVDRATGKDEL